MFGVDCTPFPGPIIPIIYIVNFHDPTGYFLATKMQMRNKDVLYISNSGSVETAKLMTYFRLVVATVNDPILAATNGLSGCETSSMAWARTVIQPSPANYYSVRHPSQAGHRVARSPSQRHRPLPLPLYLERPSLRRGHGAGSCPDRPRRCRARSRRVPAGQLRPPRHAITHLGRMGGEIAPGS